MYITTGIVTHKKNPSSAMSSQKEAPPEKSQSRTWDPYPIVPIYHPRLAVGVATDFRFEAHAEGTTSPWEMQKQRVMSAMAAMIVQNFHTVQYNVTQSQSCNTTAMAATIMRNSHEGHQSDQTRATLRQRLQRLCGIFTRRPPNSPCNTPQQWPQRLCGIFTRWSHQNSRNTHNGNGRNDYAEFSHGEHPKIPAGKIGLKTSFSKENSEQVSWAECHTYMEGSITIYG